jgi:putative ABC transport system ATP-binding protein
MPTGTLILSASQQASFVQQRPVIALQNVTKSYWMEQTHVSALNTVSLTVQRGEFVTIVGPSGSGKSTLMNMIGCLDRPTSGEYWLVGHLASQMKRAELAKMRNRYIGFVFQGFNLLPRDTAVANVALPLIYSGVGKAEREKRAQQMLGLVGLGTRMHHRPSQLSGGQQQRVAIARALVTRPSLLLADEPTGALDSRTSREIMELFKALHRQGMTVVLVTHDPGVATSAERQIILRDGSIIHDGPALPLTELLAATSIDYEEKKAAREA